MAVHLQTLQLIVHLAKPVWIPRGAGLWAELPICSHATGLYGVRERGESRSFWSAWARGELGDGAIENVGLVLPGGR
ncbi:MAG TPA: hypothetical protein VKG38_00155 [Solirubrobacteraceae bacterium]|nr:hypothetical protein [Solirubrobacteraceae bacterium]